MNNKNQQYLPALNDNETKKVQDIFFNPPIK